MVGPQAVGLVHHRAPPPNPYLTQFQAPASSTLVSTTGSYLPGQQQSGQSNTDDWNRFHSQRQRNPSISFNDRGGEDSVPTGEEAYIPSEGSSIKTDFPGHPGEKEEEGVDNPGSLSTAKESGNGTDSNGKIPSDKVEPDLHDIKLTTVNRIVSDTKEEADYVMGQTDDPIKNAFAGEGIPMNKGD